MEKSNIQILEAAMELLSQLNFSVTKQLKSWRCDICWGHIVMILVVSENNDDYDHSHLLWITPHLL